MAPLPMTADRWHIPTLVAFAVSQPLFDFIQRSPAFLTAHGATGSVAILIAVLVGLCLPIVVGIIDTALIRTIPERQLQIRAPIVGVLCTLIALPAMNGVLTASMFWPPMASVAIGAAIALAYARLQIVRRVLTAAIPAIVVFPGWFLLTDPVKALVVDASAGPQQHADAPGRPAPVVLIVFDELPVTSIMDERGRVDAVRYPHLAAFASTATWYRNAASVSDETIYAVPAILTGRYPVKPRAPTSRSYPDNLFSWLAHRYDLQIFETWTELCPADVCAETKADLVPLAVDLALLYGQTVLPSRLASRWIPPIEQRWMGVPKEAEDQALLEDPRQLRSRWVADRRKLAKAFLDACRPTRPETLCYLHVMLPHAPWQFLPSGHRYSPLDRYWLPAGVKEDGWVSDERVVAEAWQRHLLQVGFADRLLGSLVAGIRESGWFEKSLVIVTADHGVSFRPSDRLRFHTNTNLPDLAFVPLFVKRPEQRLADVSDVPVQTIDIVPTVADILDMKVNWRTDGRSLNSHERRTRLFHSSTVSEIPETAYSRTKETLRRQAAFFGTQTPWDVTYRVGPHTQLIGQYAGSLPQRSTELSMVLESPGLYSQVDLTSDFRPARVKGRLRGTDGTSEHDLAIAVNGRIATTTTTSFHTGERTFSAMIPEGAFVGGSNLIEVLEVLDGGNALALIDDRTPTESFALVHNQSGDALQNSQGYLIPIRSTGFSGNLEQREIAYSGVTVSGWAADPSKHPPSEIAIFVGDRFVDIGLVTVARPDLISGLGMLPPARAGFHRRSLLSHPAQVTPDDVRVFAVWDRRYAFELPRRPWVLVLDTDPSAAQLATSDGEIPIRQWPDSGAVEEAHFHGTRLHVEGWTGSKGGTTPQPTRLVVLQDGRLAWQGAPTSIDFGGELSGTTRQNFSAMFDVSVSGTRSARLRVFAVWRNQLATELKWNADSPITDASGRCDEE